MRPVRRLVAVFAAVALMVAPGAGAQEPGAGDEQYQDPFGGQTQTTPREPAAPAPAPLSQDAPPAPSAASPPSASGAVPLVPPAELPRTGFDALGVAVTGLGLLLAGLALRRRAAYER